MCRLWPDVQGPAHSRGITWSTRCTGMCGEHVVPARRKGSEASVEPLVEVADGHDLDTGAKDVRRLAWVHDQQTIQLQIVLSDHSASRSLRLASAVTRPGVCRPTGFAPGCLPLRRRSSCGRHAPSLCGATAGHRRSARGLCRWPGSGNIPYAPSRFPVSCRQSAGGVTRGRRGRAPKTRRVVRFTPRNWRGSSGCLGPQSFVVSAGSLCCWGC